MGLTRPHLSPDGAKGGVIQDLGGITQDCGVIRGRRRSLWDCFGPFTMSLALHLSTCSTSSLAAAELVSRHRGGCTRVA